jgi:putative ATP-dependent endonuclease of the OLD family
LAQSRISLIVWAFYGRKQISSAVTDEQKRAIHYSLKRSTAMKLSYIKIKNYKALRDVRIPLSQLVCLTGENNAGKSSVLQALSLFISPTRLDGHHFFDPSKEIEISIGFGDITEGDLARFNPEPRERISRLLNGNALELTRRFRPDGENELGYYAMFPKDRNYSKDVVDEALRGKSSKADIRGAILALFPQRGVDVPDDLSSQKAAKKLIDQWAAEVPDTEKELQFKPLPTGADFSINPLLPDDIYIPAVKDLKDDVSAKQGSSFGKVLGILMSRIESKLVEEADLFAKLQAKLTRVTKDGEVEDNRLAEIQEIESTIQCYVRESFASVDLELEIPPPELRTVLATARIFVNDGTKGPLEFKGDGLRRAVVFAILRTYVDLAAKAKVRAEATEGAVAPTERGYVMLFEEPELFLHPDAQRILFDALRVFAEEHHVIVTTHSPLFLEPGAATFVRLQKTAQREIAKPFTQATPVQLDDLAPKDEFQLICFENNNAALFAKKVVLVEGDSEVIVFPHIASLANADWLCSKHSVAFVQAKGKGSIQRYRSFFRRFGLPAFVIADLDVIHQGFDKLDPTDEQNTLRTTLLSEVDKTLPVERPEPNGEAVRDVHGKGALRALWIKAREAKQKFDNEGGDFMPVEQAVEEFFAWEKKDERLEAMRNPPNDKIRTALSELLCSLRKDGVFILSKGAIEDYYPAEGITGRDKPSKAQCYRNVVTTKEQMLSNCPNVTLGDIEKPELELICEMIFNGSQGHNR